MLFDVNDAAPIPLDRRPWGIETFRVEGYLDARPVCAQWDGHWVIASRLLCERVALAMAVDEAFAETSPDGPDAGDRDAPEAVMLALLTCCDAIDLAEYEVCGYRRVISPNA